jgi:hypothetical protein
MLVGACGGLWASLRAVSARWASLRVVGARVRAFRFWQGCARCARWCTVRAVARVRGACVVGARWCGARCAALRRVWHARTLATVRALLARVPARVAARRFRVARRWCAVRVVALVRCALRGVACRFCALLRRCG